MAQKKYSYIYEQIVIISNPLTFYWSLSFHVAYILKIVIKVNKGVPESRTD